MVLMVSWAACAQPVVEYVHRDDGAFTWKKTGEEQLPPNLRAVHFEMVSQTWQDLTWTHRVMLIMPQQMIDPQTALLLITGGMPGRQELTAMSMVVNMLGSPVVILGDIPNQPLYDGLREDALISHTFVRFLATGDANWPLLFPMTKAAIRCMDMIEAYTANEWERPVRDFVATGASKRGWTTWFTGVIADPRLRGIVPMVYDNLDLPAQMRHQIAAWGDYSPMIRDYTEKGLPDLLTTDEGRRLGSIVDPYTYRSRVGMPKLTITGTNDPYWPLDAANLYFDAFPGENFILYVPNSGHGLDDLLRVVNAQAGFFKAVTGRIPLPEPSWRWDAGRHLRLHITAGENVSQVLQWTAFSPTRDFRQAKWTMRHVAEHNGVYTCRLAYPTAGYAAIFGEITYDADGHPFPLSTNVCIVGPNGVVQAGVN